ncbi:hypothetical protein [Wenzhouxiangella sediminis]|uniref:hypothetical protein n=1 Tax=Wenzhouxiangella sediminis TaxID=1792836 RepID=UPI0015F27AFC|nr:hypothetical protein [Wenzhouxiangella sediminis]
MQAEPWVIVVAAAPGEPGSREMLELVLAGATLEVEMLVVFEAEGLAHLEPEPFAPWRQLLDFELAEVRARGSGEALLPAGVSAIDDEAFENVCRHAAGVLRL